MEPEFPPRQRAAAGGQGQGHRRGRLQLPGGSPREGRRSGVPAGRRLPSPRRARPAAGLSLFTRGEKKGAWPSSPPPRLRAPARRPRSCHLRASSRGRRGPCPAERPPGPPAAPLPTRVRAQGAGPAMCTHTLAPTAASSPCIAAPGLPAAPPPPPPPPPPRTKFPTLAAACE